MVRRLACSAIVVLVVMGLASPTSAGEQTLVRIERPPGVERNDLLADGVPLVAELSHAFLAYGDPAAVTGALAERGLASVVLDVPAGSDNIVIAFALYGRQQAWFNGVKWELVGNDVPVTAPEGSREAPATDFSA